MAKRNPRSKNPVEQIRDVLELTRKKGDDESVVSVLSDHRANITAWLPSGITPLDAILGGKGLPCGRIGEIYGGESFGKSTLAATILRSANEHNGLAVLIDTERSFDANRAEQLGLDPSKVLVLTPKTMEGVFESFERVAKLKDQYASKGPIAVVWDSMSSTSVMAELEGDYTDTNWGVHARKVSAGLRRITSSDAVIDSQIVFVVIGQERTSMNPGSDPPCLGGRALKFHASYRLRLRSSQRLEDTTSKPGLGRSSGILTTLRLTKSKICPSDREIKLPIPYRQGIDDAMACFIFMMDAGLMQKSGTWFEWGGDKFQRKGFVERCREDSEFFDSVRKAVLEYGKEEK